MIFETTCSRNAAGWRVMTRVSLSFWYVECLGILVRYQSTPTTFVIHIQFFDSQRDSILYIAWAVSRTNVTDLSRLVSSLPCQLFLWWRFYFYIGPARSRDCAAHLCVFSFFSKALSYSRSRTMSNVYDVNRMDFHFLWEAWPSGTKPAALLTFSERGETQWGFNRFQKNIFSWHCIYFRFATRRYPRTNASRLCRKAHCSNVLVFSCIFFVQSSQILKFCSEARGTFSIRIARQILRSVTHADSSWVAKFTQSLTFNGAVRVFPPLSSFFPHSLSFPSSSES